MAMENEDKVQKRYRIAGFDMDLDTLNKHILRYKQMAETGEVELPSWPDWVSRAGLTEAVCAEVMDRAAEGPSSAYYDRGRALGDLWQWCRGQYISNPNWGATVRGPDGLTSKAQNKTDKSRRSVPIIHPLMEALRAVEDKTGPVVTMGGDTVYKQVKRACAAAGVTSVDLHGLRHSFASLAYHLQIPEMIAAKIGGWNDLGTMHKIYTHLAEKDIKKRSLDFCGFFETGGDENGKSGNGSGNGNGLGE